MYSLNVQAFLDMIATSVGTIDRGDDGYNCIVGGALFNNGYVDHPNILVRLNAAGLKSDAAGRYQFLYKTWEALKAMLSLPDFSPESQDKGAVELIKERDALDDVEIGNFASAVTKCSNIWASLPGSTYGQRTNSLAALQDAYVRSGGTLA